MHDNALAAWKTMLHAVDRQVVLEVGPDRDLILKKSAEESGYTATRWDTIDLSAWHSCIQLVAKDEYNLGLESESYDVVVSANVMEHVRRPWRWVPELARVLKRGGTLILVAPSTWGYHPESWFPDCYRFWDTGMRTLLEDAGLTVRLAEHRAWVPGTTIDALGVGQKPL